MKLSFTQCRKRFIALAMLVVWMLMLGANLANACTLESAGSLPPAFDHHGKAASSAMHATTRAVPGNVLSAPAEHEDSHGLSHQAHCQPVQAIERSQAPRKTSESVFDLEAFVATDTRWARPRHSTDGGPSMQVRSDPVLAALPLFIRFRRLIP